jgi:hypothetical protein
MNDIFDFKKKKLKKALDKKSLNDILIDAIWLLDSYDDFPRVKEIQEFLREELEILNDK